MPELYNKATAVGLYNGTPDAEIYGEDSIVDVQGLELRKSANKENWIDGDLTYTLELENTSEYDFENVTITDILDPDLIVYVDGSAELDDVAIPPTEVSYLPLSGELKLYGTTPHTFTKGATYVITFRVQKKA